MTAAFELKAWRKGRLRSQIPHYTNESKLNTLIYIRNNEKREKQNEWEEVKKNKKAWMRGIT